MIDKYFDYIFCINLERRTDRRREAEAEFKKHGIKNVIFVEGIDGQRLEQPTSKSKDGSIPSKGDIGCSQSHLKVAQFAKSKGINKYFVLEDDVEFTEIFSAELLESFMVEVPYGCDMLYFGGNHNGGFEMVNDKIAKIYETFTTHCYGVMNEKSRDAIIEVLSKADEKVDVAIASLHSKLNCYVTRPHLAFQRASHSDILNKFTDYIHLRT